MLQQKPPPVPRRHRIALRRDEARRLWRCGSHRLGVHEPKLRMVDLGGAFGERLYTQPQRIHSGDQLGTVDALQSYTREAAVGKRVGDVVGAHDAGIVYSIADDEGALLAVPADAGGTDAARIVRMIAEFGVEQGNGRRAMPEGWAASGEAAGQNALAAAPSLTSSGKGDPRPKVA